MRKPTRTAAVLVGLGVGAAAGAFIGPAAGWAGVAVAALGLVLSLRGTSSASDLIRDGTNPERPATGRRREPEPAAFAHLGLGQRVEELLSIAEEHADDVRAEARREAERIEAVARQEAEKIMTRAREEAAGITATGPNLPSGPLSWTRPPGENPNSPA